MVDTTTSKTSKTAVSPAQTAFHAAMLESCAEYYVNAGERSVIALSVLWAIQTLVANAANPADLARIIREEFGSIGVAANASGHVIGKLTHALRADGYLPQRGAKKGTDEKVPSESRAVDMFAARARSIAYASMSGKYDVNAYESFNAAYEAAKEIVGKKRTPKATDEAAPKAVKFTADDLTGMLKSDLKGTLKLIAKALRNSKETLKATTVEAWIAAQ